MTDQKLQVSIEDASDRDEPDQPHQRVARDAGHGKALRPPRSNRPSMMPPPLTLPRTQDVGNGRLRSQLPTHHENHAGVGTRSIGLQIPAHGEAAHHTDAVAAASSPAMLDSRQSNPPFLQRNTSREATSRQPSPREPRIEAYPYGHQLQNAPQNGVIVPSTPQHGYSRRQSAWHRQSQTPTRDGASLPMCFPLVGPRPVPQAPRKKPRGPRPPATRDLSTIQTQQRTVNDRSHELIQPATATPPLYEQMNSQRTNMHTNRTEHAPRRRSGANHVHMVLIEEQDLVDLIARGILKSKSGSRLPSCLLKALENPSVPKRARNGEIEILQNAERRIVTEQHSTKSLVRHMSCHADVETSPCSRCGPADDSGYCTASPAASNSTSIVRLSESERALWRAIEQFGGSSVFNGRKRRSSLPEIGPTSWLAKSTDQSDVLRRRSSVPSLRRLFRIAVDGEDDAENECEAHSYQDCAMEQSGPLGALTLAMSLSERNSCCDCSNRSVR